MPGRNLDCTSFEIEKSWRERMKNVAKANELSMKDWLHQKIEESELKIK